MSSLYPSLSNNQPADEMEMKDAPDNGRFRMWLCLGYGYPYSFSTYRIPVPERTGRTSSQCLYAK